MNYQPGKSQFIKITGVLSKSGGGSGVTAGIGYYDDDNGIFLKDDEGTYKFVLRSSVTGSVVDTEVEQASWNFDSFDGSGPSGVTLDFTKSHIVFFDLEWLGVGTVRCGFVVDGNIFVAHVFKNANINAGVYMSTPNLPVRYEIENDGTGAASSIETICCEVQSEGGVQPVGVPRYQSTGATVIDAASSGTTYALLGIRLKAVQIDAAVTLARATVTESASTSVDCEWQIRLNPTVAGTFTYSDVTNSAVQIATGAVANTVTGGTIIAGGLLAGGKESVSDIADLRSIISLGAAIDGTPQEIILVITPFANNADARGALEWLEVS